MKNYILIIALCGIFISCDKNAEEVTLALQEEEIIEEVTQPETLKELDEESINEIASLFIGEWQVTYVKQTYCDLTVEPIDCSFNETFGDNIANLYYQKIFFTNDSILAYHTATDIAAFAVGYTSTQQIEFINQSSIDGIWDGTHNVTWPNDDQMVLVNSFSTQDLTASFEDVYHLTRL